MRVRRVLAFVGLLLVATAATALAVAPSGNQKGIALARAQVRAYSKVTTVSGTESGFVAMRDEEGRTSFFSWTWGDGLVPPGWSRAVEHTLLVLRRGRVAWWRDDLAPPPCTAPGICMQIPVEIVGERSGTFFAFGNALRHTCYAHLNGTTPYRVGYPFDSVAGRFDAPVRRGGVWVLTEAYPWFGQAKQMATETDRISARTLLTLSGRVSVARGLGQSRPAFTLSYHDSYPAGTPAVPRVNRCKG